ncbi:MAG: ATP-binding protein [Gammaproteobacteria bacterium]|nr:ATP-binding protein [Gammaproteobacteria bacterium]
MTDRKQLSRLRAALAEAPAVALLGPRQVGKTTLALAVAEGSDDQPAPLYLDLAMPADRAKLAEPERYLSTFEDRLVILDGIERVPELLQTICGLIDSGRNTGRFLLIGLASPALMQQTRESLDARIRVLELAPVSAAEIAASELDNWWLRGGLPESLLAPSDALSLRVRTDVIRNYLERDIPQLGPRIAAETLRRFWTMLAHRQASLLNQAEVARALGVDGKTVAAYLDLMVDLLLVRRLPPWNRQTAKRLVKSPKVSIRDSGLMHALLGIETLDALLGHPIAGSSWEGMVIESLLAAAPEGTEACFYRTAVGAEIDLVLSIPGKGRWAIEITRRLTPKLERGFHHACEDVQPDAGFIVYPGAERYSMTGGVEAVSLVELCKMLGA